MEKKLLDAATKRDLDAAKVWNETRNIEEIVI